MLRGTLEIRDVHAEVIQYCRAELLEDNYAYAVLEATKSVFDRVRDLTEFTDDGAQLMDKAFGGGTPILAINALTSESEISEQRGFVNLAKGVYGMFRNPTAQEARIKWSMGRADAEDLLSLVSLIHRRLDGVGKRS